MLSEVSKRRLKLPGMFTREDVAHEAFLLLVGHPEWTVRKTVTDVINKLQRGGMSENDRRIRKQVLIEDRVADEGGE